MYIKYVYIYIYSIYIYQKYLLYRLEFLVNKYLNFILFIFADLDVKLIPAT